MPGVCTPALTTAPDQGLGQAMSQGLGQDFGQGFDQVSGRDSGVPELSTDWGQLIRFTDWRGRGLWTADGLRP